MAHDDSWCERSPLLSKGAKQGQPFLHNHLSRDDFKVVWGCSLMEVTAPNHMIESRSLELSTLFEYCMSLRYPACQGADRT